ncbi:hypothetical protein P9B03_19485 [Metasolibacillus meyeri]|uniref:DUF3667 domain-containing protein n=1 Tax=Metasolibacillus meyeri TaxID=1071052 RepID=A0AAW9NX46_9BACL|nr:hypothetical protein [Metasolibacillus meyeri]MEC1180650.1 hypothetical protein [Metasolibacillus meyeri]
MFDFKQLVMKPSEEKKEQQYRLLEKRLQKKRTPLLPIILPPVIVLLACLLFLTMPSQLNERTGVESNDLVQILGTLGEGNPSSIYRFDVKNITNSVLRDSFEQALREMQPIKLSQEPDITYTVQLTYENGVVEQYFIEWAENVHFGDMEGQWYVVENPDLYNTLAGLFFPITKRQFRNAWFILIILMCSLWILEKGVRPQGHDGKKLPLYSMKLQYVIDVVMMLIIVVPLVVVKNPFVFSCFAAVIISGGVKLWLEARFGGESWRYKIIVYRTCYLLIAFSYVIYMGAALNY